MGSSSYNNYYHEIDSSFDSSNNRLFRFLWSGYYVRIHCLVLELKILLYKSLEMTFSSVVRDISRQKGSCYEEKSFLFWVFLYKRVVNTKDLQWGKRILRNKKAAFLYGETVPQTAERHFESFRLSIIPPNVRTNIGYQKIQDQILKVFNKWFPWIGVQSNHFDLKNNLVLKKDIQRL